MLVGIVGAMSLAFTSFSPLHAFPFLLVLCLFVCVIASLLTKPDDMEVLKTFYIKVRPWGFWKPVRDAVQLEHPEVQGNPHFLRDMANVVVGVVWQTSLVAAPIFLVIKHWLEFGVAMAIAIATSAILWKFWWKTLEDYPADTPVKYLPATQSEMK
jgi:SSS family solute:Na+ symporter